jgi:hypothetical protein
MPVEAHESALTAMQTTLVAMQVQQGRIESTLNIVVTQHERRIEENSRETRQLRVDLDAVKDNADKKISLLAEKSNNAFQDGRRKVISFCENLITELPQMPTISPKRGKMLRISGNALTAVQVRQFLLSVRSLQPVPFCGM